MHVDVNDIIVWQIFQQFQFVLEWTVRFCCWNYLQIGCVWWFDLCVGGILFEINIDGWATIGWDETGRMEQTSIFCSTLSKPLTVTVWWATWSTEISCGNTFMAGTILRMVDAEMPFVSWACGMRKWKMIRLDFKLESPQPSPFSVWPTYLKFKIDFDIFHQIYQITQRCQQSYFTSICPSLPIKCWCSFENVQKFIHVYLLLTN